MFAPTYPYRLIPRNSLGRDFIVGDIHGCYSLLQEALVKIGFDVRADRLFCTGDLVDRGPEPVECLELLEQPWFYAVVGNHERMLRSRVGRGERWRTRVQAAFHSGEWLESLDDSRQARLAWLVGLVSKLPGVLEVESGKESFFLVHAQRPVANGLPMADSQFRAAGSSAAHLESTTWGRQLFRKFEKQLVVLEKVENQFCTVGERTGDRLTYVGHSIVGHPAIVDSHVFIDGGAYRQTRGEGGTLFIVEHVPDKGPRLVYPLR
jgi:serine/threonine protein phosphatase 1